MGGLRMQEEGKARGGRGPSPRAEATEGRKAKCRLLGGASLSVAPGGGSGTLKGPVMEWAGRWEDIWVGISGPRRVGTCFNKKRKKDLCFGMALRSGGRGGSEVPQT